MIIVTLLLAACAPQQSQPTTGTTGTTGTGTTAATTKGTETTTQGTTEGSTEPLPAGKVSVSVFDRGTTGQTQPNDNYWTAWIIEGVKRDLNVDVEFVAIPRSEEVTKLNILMAATSAPDICFTYDSSLVCNYIVQGGLTDLTDLVAQNGANLNANLGDEVLKYGRFYGKQYTIPARRNFISGTSYWIRKDWVDSLGMEIPDTTEEWYQTMVAFKEKNPGNVDSVIPIGVNNGAGVGYLNFSFVKLDEMSDEDWACMNEFMRPGTKDFYRYMNKLNAEGLLSPDFALQKDDKKRDADVMAGRVGFIATPGVVDYPLRNQPGLVANLWKNVEGAELVPCDPFSNAKGEHLKILYPLYGIFAFTPSFSEHAKEAVQYLDWITNYDVIKFLQFGEVGVQHKDVGGGVLSLIPLDNERKQNSPSNSDYTITQNGVNLLGNKEINLKSWVYGYGEQYAALAEATFNVGMTDGILEFYFDRPIEASSKYTVALNDKATTLRNQVITTDPSEFDQLYDSLFDDYMKSGGQEIYDERVVVFNLMKQGK